MVFASHILDVIDNSIIIRLIGVQETLVRHYQVSCVTCIIETVRDTPTVVDVTAQRDATVGSSIVSAGCIV